MATLNPGDRADLTAWMTSSDPTEGQPEPNDPTETSEGMLIYGPNGFYQTFTDYSGSTHPYSITGTASGQQIGACLYRTDNPTDESGYINVTITAGVDAAALYSQSPYPTIDPGQSVSIFITAQNTGTTTWSGSRGYTYIGLDHWSYLGEHPLANDVPPGGTTGVTDTVTPPTTPGSYNYALEFRHNGAVIGPYFFITVTVRAPVSIQSVTVAPTSTFVPAGRTVQYAATAHYSNGAQQDVTNAASWYTSDSTKATITQGGLAATHAPGNIQIEAIYGGYAGYAALEIDSPVLDRLNITPQGPTMIAGDSLGLTVIGTFSDGSTSNITAFATWQSLSPTIATVSSSGTVLAVYPGAATITATVSGVVGSTIIRVNAKPVPTPRVYSTGFAMPFSGTVYFTGGPHFETLPDPATCSANAEYAVATTPGSGLDFASSAGYGAPVLSMADGKVITHTYRSDGFGYVVYVDYSPQASPQSGYIVMYAHLDGAAGFPVPDGATIQQGDIIGYEGNSGTAAIHLHIELFHGGTAYANRASWEGLVIDGWTVHTGYVDQGLSTGWDYQGTLTQGAASVTYEPTTAAHPCAGYYYVSSQTNYPEVDGSSTVLSSNQAKQYQPMSSRPPNRSSIAGSTAPGNNGGQAPSAPVPQQVVPSTPEPAPPRRAS